MRISLTYRVIISALVIGLALLYALPTFLGKENPLQSVLPDKEVNLGLDLKGGMSLTLGVDMDKALSSSLGQMGENLRVQAKDEGIVIIRPRVVGSNMLRFYLLDADKAKRLQEIIERNYDNKLSIQGKESMGQGRIKYTLSMTSEYRNKLKEMTLDQALKVMRNRINEFGVSEPDIRRMKGNRIQVQLPGLEDSERAVELVKRTAHLEFRLVDEDSNAQKAVRGRPPSGSELFYFAEQGPESKNPKPIVLKKQVLMTGQHIADASVAFNRYNQPYVSLTFDDRGARIFERVTGNHVNERMAIVLDGKVYSAPTIQEKIRGGRASITGNFSDQEAHDLAIVLRAGSLPAPVNVLHERSVGPSLGQQSIQQGVTALVVGGLLVLVFAIAYYGIGGVIVDLLLGFNMLIIIAVLAGFGATLTLPGIAGIILLVGTAMDASVLIFERIREERRKGMSPAKAVDEAFVRSSLTIMDANVTTILAALILYQFGTGPIRGFAVTLTVGTFASLFTAIFVSRTFFEFWLKRKRPESSFNL
ncbi:MAG: protein translocase subunit SecD [Desulfohalobiaceae bacterium]|nr:protein translocase subunit SecD [Desulfohalobiaceae bacterium]MCF8086164.1 protein translocase subunit SecD [Desulfohalobiaceae bacterium]